jgi:uncharacterized membrane protein
MKIKKHHLLIVLFSFLGLLASFIITLEKIELIKNPDYIPPCNINPLFSCKNVMNSDYASLFGFPNPILGLVGYSVMLTVGMFLLLKGKPSKIFMILANWGSLAALIFSYVLIYLSMYQIGTLCVYCLLSCFSATNLFFAVTYTNFKLRFIHHKIFEKKKYLLLVIGFNLLVVFWIILKFPAILSF